MTDLALDVAKIDFDKGGGLATVVVQDARTDAVLMVAYANREAVERTLATRQLHFYSRSRARLWLKGESSGNVLDVERLTLDCDGDTILAHCRPRGPACHTGARTCFGEPHSGDAIRGLQAVVEARAGAMESGGASEASYTVKLLGDRNLRLKKLGEEMAELVVALADGDRARATQEAADVVYHLTVALRAAGVTMDEVREALRSRAK